MAFADRSDAGRRLAEALLEIQGLDPVVLALPRGGVPVAAEVAARLERADRPRPGAKDRNADAAGARHGRGG